MRFGDCQSCNEYNYLERNGNCPTCNQSSDNMDLTQISGVSKKEEKILKNNGLTTIDDLKNTKQLEIADIDEIGMALAARIKAWIKVEDD